MGNSISQIRIIWSTQSKYTKCTLEIPCGFPSILIPQKWQIAERPGRLNYQTPRESKHASTRLFNDTYQMMMLDNVAVHPDRRGQGLGPQLMAFAENEAAKQGYSSQELYTHESMTENIGLDESLGYVETDRRTESGYRGLYAERPDLRARPG